jgi:uncharacterized membrane protein YphA (DoxX/SURF4 family)/thiol-disulfide isomerase/thioredoxin
VDLALLLARLVLGAVFLLAGIAKLGDPKGVSKAFSDFGLPRALAALFGLLLPLVEIGIAIALIPVALAWYGACAALALLSIFVIGIAITLARGRKADCHCFGQLHSAPVGRSTLVRNGMLGGLACWLVFRGPMRDGPSLWRHLASAGDNERRLFAVAAVVMFFLLWRASRQSDAEESENAAEETETSDWEDDDDTPGPRTPAPEHQPHDAALQKILEAGTGWPIGTTAPDFALADITGQKCSLQSLRDQGKTICLVFSSPHCDPCRALWPHLGRWAREHDGALNIVVVSRGAATESVAKQNGFEASRVLLQQAFELSDAYGVTSTPAAVLIGTDGLIQSQLAVGREDIQQLIASSWYADTSKEKHS